MLSRRKRQNARKKDVSSSIRVASDDEEQASQEFPPKAAGRLPIECEIADSVGAPQELAPNATARLLLDPVDNHDLEVALTKSGSRVAYDAFFRNVAKSPHNTSPTSETSRPLSGALLDDETPSPPTSTPLSGPTPRKPPLPLEAQARSSRVALQSRRERTVRSKMTTRRAVDILGENGGPQSKKRLICASLHEEDFPWTVPMPGTYQCQCKACRDQQEVFALSFNEYDAMPLTLTKIASQEDDDDLPLSAIASTVPCRAHLHAVKFLDSPFSSDGEEDILPRQTSQGPVQPPELRWEAWKVADVDASQPEFQVATGLLWCQTAFERDLSQQTQGLEIPAGLFD